MLEKASTIKRFERSTFGSGNIQNHKIGFKSGIKILIPNKLLTRLPVILALVNAGNNSHKLRPEIRQILYFLHQNIKITKK